MGFKDFTLIISTKFLLKETRFDRFDVAVIEEEIEVLKAYNEQMQNENNCLGERADEYKEWYGVAKERVMRLEAKIEAYKEVLRLVLKENR